MIAIWYSWGEKVALYDNVSCTLHKEFDWRLSKILF